LLLPHRVGEETAKAPGQPGSRRSRSFRFLPFDLTATTGDETECLSFRIGPVPCMRYSAAFARVRAAWRPRTGWSGTRTWSRRNRGSSRTARWCSRRYLRLCPGWGGGVLRTGYVRAGTQGTRCTRYFWVVRALIDNTHVNPYFHEIHRVGWSLRDLRHEQATRTHRYRYHGLKRTPHEPNATHAVIKRGSFESRVVHAHRCSHSLLRLTGAKTDGVTTGG